MARAQLVRHKRIDIRERANDAATAEPDDAAYQTKIAQAIAAAVLAWKQQEVKP